MVEQGWRYHMSNIMAAIGIVQLKRFESLSSKRQNLSKAYNIIFNANDRIIPIEIDLDNVVPHIYVVRIIDLKDRKMLQDKMLESGIETGYHYQPNHWLNFFGHDVSEPLKLTDKIFPELLSLPLHPDLTRKDIEKVATTLIRIVKDDY